MEDITYQALLGATVTEAAIRILWALCGGLLTMFGFWGMRRRIRKLEEQQQRPVVVNVGPGAAQPKPLPNPSGASGTVAEHLPKDRIVRVGTKAGPMEIRLSETDWLTEDVCRILDRNGVLAPLDS